MVGSIRLYLQELYRIVTTGSRESLPRLDQSASSIIQACSDIGKVGLEAVRIARHRVVGTPGTVYQRWRIHLTCIMDIVGAIDGHGGLTVGQCIGCTREQTTVKLHPEFGYGSTVFGCGITYIVYAIRSGVSTTVLGKLSSTTVTIARCSLERIRVGTGI
jgi:hypothetical protein